MSEFTCKAIWNATPDPQDCGWPACGCDPYANKVISALEESGSIVGRAEHDRRITELLEANTREVERRREAEAEVSRLEALVYVPGVWRCPKCQLSLVSTILDASSGRIAANKEPQRCPNDCGPMWRVTERDAGNRLIDDMDREVERRREAEAKLAWRPIASAPKGIEP